MINNNEVGNMKKLIQLIATYFGLGYISRAPGTVASLMALPLVYCVYLLGPVQYMIFTFLLTIAGVIVCEAYEKMHEGHDRQEIVIDEVVGILITMTWMPQTWQAFVAGFLLFRFFDILKPFPIGKIDKKIGGGLGVMLDDVAAGVIANIILQVIYTKTNWLGSQILFN